MEKIHNLYITSISKNDSKDTNYNYNLYFSNYGINIKEDEEAYLNIKTFQTLNSFYNINDNSKFFTFKVRNDYDITTTYNFTLETGNYDIYEFQDMVNGLCSQYFTMTYNKNKNVWNYKASVINTEVFIQPNQYNYKYFGLKPDIFSVIQYTSNYIGTYSNIINMNNFSLIIIKIIGLIEENKNIDNFNNSVSRGDIGAIINRQDVAVGALINWNDNNSSFIKKISNNEINYLNFKFSNEFGDELKDINDWLITLSIIIKKKV
jgi:hypothetical protein